MFKIIIEYTLSFFSPIMDFLDDDSGRIISDKGMYILSNPELYKDIMEEHNKSK